MGARSHRQRFLARPTDLAPIVELVLSTPGAEIWEMYSEPETEARRYFSVSEVEQVWLERKQLVLLVYAPEMGERPRVERYSFRVTKGAPEQWRERVSMLAGIAIHLKGVNRRGILECCEIVLGSETHTRAIAEGDAALESYQFAAVSSFAGKASAAGEETWSRGRQHGSGSQGSPGLGATGREPTAILLNPPPCARSLQRARIRGRRATRSGDREGAAPTLGKAGFGSGGVAYL